MTLKVQKRDGSLQELELDKIHGHTEYATRGIEGVSQAELETDSCIQFYDGMPTTQIQKTLILTAADKISLESSGWSKVATRLTLQDLFKEVTGDSFKYPTMRSYIKKGIKIGVLDKRLMKDFDLEAIDKAIIPERDELFEYLGLTTLSDRYFIRDKNGRIGKKGLCLELPQHFFMRVSMGLALAEKPEERTKWAIEFYDVLSNLEYMPSTPTLFNAGTNFAQLSSCFLLSMGDSLKGIMSSLEEAASYSKFAGGIGIELGQIRSQGSYIASTQGVAGGPIPYTKLVNDILLAFDQGGKRKGSGAVYLPDWHSDMSEFLDITKAVGDDRRRARDVFPATWMSDVFMERLCYEEDPIWSMFSPSDVPELNELYGDAFKAAYLAAEKEGKALDQISLMNLWRKTIEAKFGEGKYFTCFKDTINRRNMQRGSGIVRSSNLCTEITLNTVPSDWVDPISAVCNLGSINLAVVDYRNVTKLSRVVTIAVRMLNNVIDIGHIPHKNGKKFNDREKAVGLGIMGYAEFLAQNGIDFESQEHLDTAAAMMKEISFWAINASADLAQERGSYELFDKSEWAKGNLPHDTAPRAALDLIGNVPFGYGEDRERVLRAKTIKGMRNSHLMAIAPTATIANIVGTTECIQLPTQLIYEKENLSGVFTAVAPTLKYESLEVAKTMRSVSMEWVIKAAAIRQIYIDQSQSLNLYLPLDRQIKGSEISEWYKLAWKLGVKTTYYLRNKSAGDDGSVKKKEDPEVVTTEVTSPTPQAEGSYEDEVAPMLCSIDNPECEACQ